MSKEQDHLDGVHVRGVMTRRDFIGGTAALGVAVSAAGSMLAAPARADTPRKGGTLKLGAFGGEATNSLDPATFTTPVQGYLGNCWGETLVEVDAAGKVVFRLAESVEPSPDARTFVFRIRKDVTFHNGKTMDAADVLATMQRHSDETSKSGALGIMGGIESMKADGANFIVTTKGPNADLPFLMADYHLVIQPNGGKDGAEAAIGTGAYRLVTNEPGVRHVGERFAGYWDAGDRGFADSVEIIVINDMTARLSALQSGAVHMINRVEPKIVERVKQLPGVSVRNISGRGHYAFPMRCDAPPFDNNDLRLALKLSVDRKDMVSKILQGYGAVGNDMPISSAYPFFPADIEQRDYDPDKAAFHYKKSGHSGPILFQTSDGAFPGAVDAGQLFQQTAAKAGITIDLHREPADGYWTNVWNKQPFCASYWNGRPTQDQMYSSAYLSNVDWNESRFFNPSFDKLVVEARSELDPARRQTLYREIGLLVRDEGGSIIPMFNDWIDAVSDTVGGFVPDPNSDLMGSKALVKCWLAV